MKKYIIGILIIFTVLFGCEKEQSTGNQTNQPTQEVNTTLNEEVQGEAPFFWKVKNKGNTVYLLGSIHVGSEDMYPMNQIVEDAYQSSDSLVVEANILQNPESMLEEELLAKAVYNDGSFLMNHISMEVYEQLEAVVSNYDQEGMTMMEINYFKPWFIELLLTQLLISEEETLDAQYGIDVHFLERATADNKSILELESMKEQIAFFSDMPDEIQIQSLENSIKALQQDTDGNEILQLIEAWKSGSEEQLASVISIDEDGRIPEYKAYQEELMKKRNTKMVEKIKGYLTNGSGQTYFVVVGAAHYIDEIGLDNLLENEFTVQSYAEMN
jgi:uncharacterized protein